jgi:hypothetical protein
MPAESPTSSGYLLDRMQLVAHVVIVRVVEVREVGGASVSPAATRPERLR